MSRRHLTASGRFEVVKWGGFLHLRHAVLMLNAGRFSHLSVHTIKAALAGVEQAESLISPADLALIDGEAKPHDDAWKTAMARLVWALRQAFPNGAWSH